MTNTPVTPKERIEVALALAAGMLDLDAGQMGDDKAAGNCRGAARILRENYELLIAAPAMLEALEHINACIAWRDDLQRWELLHRDLAFPELNKVRHAIAAAGGRTY